MNVFEVSEYRARVARAQGMMAEADLAALLLTTEPEVRYFSGYLTRFWESPSRPWFLIVPAGGDPVAVIPEIGAALMARGWIDDIRTWASPQPEDEGVSLLSRTLNELTASDARIGLPMGPDPICGCRWMIWRALATRSATDSLPRTRALSSACAW